MQQQTHDNVILELTVRNHPGVMTHVCGLFARRAFRFMAGFFYRIEALHDDRHPIIRGPR